MKQRSTDGPTNPERPKQIQRKSQQIWPQIPITIERLQSWTFDVFQKAVRHENTQQPIRTPRYKNTNKKELEALKQLANNPNIVIRKADKGSCVVVQDTVKYLDECFKQLSDRRFYMRETRKLTLEHNKKVHNLVNELMEKGSISEEVAKNLKISNPSLKFTKT